MSIKYKYYAAAPNAYELALQKFNLAHRMFYTDHNRRSAFAVFNQALGILDILEPLYFEDGGDKELAAWIKDFRQRINT